MSGASSSWRGWIWLVIDDFGLKPLRVIGMDLDYEVLGQENGMFVIAFSGTAVVVA